MFNSDTRRCRRRLTELGLPGGSAQVADIAEHLARLRGRPIWLKAVPWPQGGPSGAWLPTDDHDVVLYDATASPRHQAQIISHELAHIAWGHVPSPHDGQALPLLAYGAARLMLTRSTYTKPQEVEAERLADMFVRHMDSASEASSDDEFGDALRRGGPHRA